MDETNSERSPCLRYLFWSAVVVLLTFYVSLTSFKIGMEHAFKLTSIAEEWDSTKQYSGFDVVFHNGSYYYYAAHNMRYLPMPGDGQTGDAWVHLLDVSCRCSSIGNAPKLGKMSCAQGYETKR